MNTADYYPADADHLRDLINEALGKGSNARTLALAVIYGESETAAFDLATLKVVGQFARLKCDWFIMVDDTIQGSRGKERLSAIGERMARASFDPAKIATVDLERIEALDGLAWLAEVARSGDQVNFKTEQSINEPLALAVERCAQFYDCVLVFRSIESPFLQGDVTDLLGQFVSESVIFDVSISCGREAEISQDLIPHLWRVRLFTRNELPKWEPYDHISHFLNYGWGHFEESQEQAAKRIAEIFDQQDINVQHLYDVGCGSGELTDHLFNQLTERRRAPNTIKGYDPSLWQVRQAQKRLAGIGGAVAGKLDDVHPESAKGALVLMLGNTMAHVGGKTLWDWLRSQKTHNPEYIVFDFAENWRTLLHQAEPEIVCGPLTRMEIGPVLAHAHMTTAGGPGWVKRGIVVQFERRSGQLEKGENTLDAHEHRLFTKQFADPPETYFKVLRAHGYVEQCEPEHYVSGWGRHDLHVYRYKGGDAEPEWPQAADDGMNQVWYAALCENWQRLPGEYSRWFAHGSAKLELFPAAILPFGGNGQVFARYVPRTADEREGKWRHLFKATMRLVDPKDPDLHHAGAPKREHELPYAPAIYRALLGRAPASTIEHFDMAVDELRIDANASDWELADLERGWMNADSGSSALNVPDAMTTEQAYYALPIYLDGMPGYLVAVRVTDIHALGKSVLEAMAVLNSARQNLTEILREVIDESHWTNIVVEWAKIGVPYERLSNALHRIEQFDWTSWLHVLPGSRLVGIGGTFGIQFEELKKRHANAVKAYYASGEVQQIGARESANDTESDWQYVTLNQAAAIVNRSKRTLERRKTKDANMPPPDVEGGGGKPDEWLWNNIRPWLESEYGKKLPERFPSHLPP